MMTPPKQSILLSNVFAFNFCFQIIDFDQSVCREWQIFGLVSAVCVYKKAHLARGRQLS
jgi:hypothetical protein